MNREQSAFASYPSPYTAIPADSCWQTSYFSQPGGFFGQNARPVYQTLDNYGKWCDSYGGMSEQTCSAAPTDRTRWACPSLPDIPSRGSTAFYRMLNVPQKLEELPAFHVSGEISDDIRLNQEETADKLLFTPPKRTDTAPPPQDKVVNFQGRFEIAPVRNVQDNEHRDLIERELQTQEMYTDCGSACMISPSTTLLPVMDYGYNIREIIKNCILLEDHLIHPEKRCNDCCVKHFLFLEGLAEEARTLDRDNQMPPELRDAPDFFRNCQQQYYTISTNPQQNPDIDYNAVAQKLRNFRKMYQQRYFPILWSPPSTTNQNGTSSGCTNGMCPNS